jgi:hypothetical protein
MCGVCPAANTSKPRQANPSKNAWFCLVLFVRIGTFQWVAAEKARKSSPPSLRRAASREARARIWRIGKNIALTSDFRKGIARLQICVPAPAISLGPSGPVESRGPRLDIGAETTQRPTFTVPSSPRRGPRRARRDKLGSQSRNRAFPGAILKCQEAQRRRFDLWSSPR